ncbi:GNAT family N-acetyltransferase [Marinomonas algicola]|uniref:GNAT family N-acetyltransferase n=1 Tax=Marinomonas algicola TaxID=2773454 RepID=UPI001749ADBB|nr:GNAT family N-acetyltransferase [Marinomonas algicola]
MSEQSLYTVEQSSRLLFPLAKNFYQSYYPSGKPNKADPIWLLKGPEIICAYRLKLFDDYQLLTAMVTKPSYREQGLASYLLNHTKEALQAKQTYCFAFEHLEHFYKKNGFCTVNIQDLPNHLEERFVRYTLSGKKLVPMRFRF